MTGSGWPWSDRRGDPRGSGGPVTCERFRDVAEDLALGAINDPERAELFAHAAGCPACQARLDELALLTDRLLLAAPELEPPAGFEGRVLDHLTATAASGATARAALGSAAAVTAPGAETTTPGVARGRAPRRRSLLVLVAAVLLVTALGAGGFLLGRSTVQGADAAAPPGAASTGSTSAGGAPARSGVDAARSGPIVRADGSRSGTAMLVEQPRPLVLVTIDSPRPSANRVSCELVLADGTAMTVGTWGYDDVAGGAWAVGIPPKLLDAVQMNVRDASGGVIATAQLR
jgi:hypothetical protein